MLHNYYNSSVYSHLNSVADLHITITLAQSEIISHSKKVNNVTPDNAVTLVLKSLLPSQVSDRKSEVSVYVLFSNTGKSLEMTQNQQIK